MNFSPSRLFQGFMNNCICYKCFCNFWKRTLNNSVVTSWQPLQQVELHVLPVNPHRHQIHRSYVWFCKCRFLIAGVLQPLSNVSPEHGRASHQPPQRGACSAAVSPARLGFLLLHPLRSSLLWMAWCMCSWWGCLCACVPRGSDLGAARFPLETRNRLRRVALVFCTKAGRMTKMVGHQTTVYIWDAKKATL